MHEVLLNYIQNKSQVRLTSEEADLIRSAFIPKKFRKRQFFLEEGQVCMSGGFIVKGAMRQYTVDEKGNEHVVQLFLENWWIGDFESMATGTPSNYYIDAWEETHALLASFMKFRSLQTIPAVARLGELLAVEHVNAMSERLHKVNTIAAEDRLETLLKVYPEFMQRFPQHIIASYLGITRETLSRLRRNSVKK